MNRKRILLTFLIRPGRDRWALSFLLHLLLALPLSPPAAFAQSAGPASAHTPAPAFDPDPDPASDSALATAFAHGVASGDPLADRVIL